MGYNIDMLKIKCEVAKGSEISATPLTHEYNMCDVCDTLTPFAKCDNDMVCVLCHNAYIEDYHIV